MDLTTALSTVARLETQLKGQAREAVRMQAYYDGEHGLRFASQEWREHFEQQFAGFADNWCAPVVDAKVERERVVGFRPFGASAADTELRRIWQANGLDAESRLAFTEASHSARSYALVWPNDDDEATPLQSFESPTQCTIAYASGSRRQRAAGLKLWTDDDGTDTAYLYTPTELWKLIRKPITDAQIEAGEAAVWVPDGDDAVVEHHLGRVPLVELPNRPRLAGPPRSDIAGVAAMQDAINLLWAQLFTASDFAALPQRVMLGVQLPKIPVLDSSGKKVGEKPVNLTEANVRRILNLEGPEAKIDSWPAAELKPFLEVISQAVGHVASQTRTPAYYFITGGTIANIGADAIKALDAGLVQRTRDSGQFLSEGLLEMQSLTYLAKGDPVNARLIRSGATQWADMEVRSEAQLADASLKYKSIGFPFEWIAKRHIDDPDELAEVLRQHDAEQDLYASLGIKPPTGDGPDEDLEAPAA